MDAATAALIGAGTAAAVSIGAQFLAHQLAIARDRRNQHRERLFGVIVEAATALYEPLVEPPPREPGRPPPRPGTIAALDPTVTDPDFMAYANSSFKGMSLLMVHFGHDHFLVDAYQEASIDCMEAGYAKAAHFGSDDDQARMRNIRDLAGKARAAQLARDRWMRTAREYVEAL